MTANPYRAGGVYDGVAYVERESDTRLYLEIERNRGHLLVTAPRQGGRTSAMHRALRRVRKGSTRCVFVDFSQFPESCFSGLDEFLTRFASEVCTPLGIPVVAHDDMTMLMEEILAACLDRIVVFLDDVDMVRGRSYDDYFFGAIRASFNRRPIDEKFRRLQFVMSGFCDPECLVGQRLFSPYNVGIEIPLRDLDLGGVCSMTEHLAGDDTRFEIDPATLIYDHTRGSVYLTQLVLEHLWQVCQSCYLVTGDNFQAHIVEVVNEIVKRAPRVAHFLAIYRATHAAGMSPELVASILGGETVRGVEASVLASAGIVGDDFRIRNPIYRRVFSSDGSLPLRGDNAPIARELSNRSEHTTTVNSRYALFGASKSRRAGLGGINLSTSKESSAVTIVHCEGDYMETKNISNIGPGAIVGANAVGKNATATGTVNSGSSTGALTQEQHKAAIKETQNALNDDQDALERIDSRLYEALAQFLTMARKIQVDQQSLADVQAKMKETLDDVWAQQAAKGLRPQPLSGALKVIEALGNSPITAEIAKHLVAGT